MDPEPITLILNARKNLQTVTDLVSNYERTRDVNILDSAIKLSLSVFDDALRALMVVRGVRVRDWGYARHLISYLVPGDIVNPGLRDSLAECLSRGVCDPGSLTARVQELGRFIEYVHSMVTHRVTHLGL